MGLFDKIKKAARGTVKAVSLNVVNVGYEFEVGEFRVYSIETFDNFFERYKRLIAGLSDFPIEKTKLVKLVKRALNVNTFLADDILERIKKDLGLYEKEGVIYEIQNA